MSDKITNKITNKKIAFLFLTIDDVNFPKVWKNYFAGNEDKFTIYCHPKYPDKVITDWLKSNIIPNLVETGWGYIVGAYQQLLKNAYLNESNYKFVTISESCLPLVPFNEFYNSMFNTDGANIKTSYIKFMEIKDYDLEQRIKVNAGYTKYNFHKHYARFCLSRYHVKKLLEMDTDFEFFKRMHIGDEFFLTMLEPYDNVKDFAITYDNWDYVFAKRKKFNIKIKKLYEKMEKISNKQSQTRIKSEIKDLQIIRDDFSRNPKSYSEVTIDDIKELNGVKSFFWRKFPKNSNIENFYFPNKCCLK